MLLLAAGHIQFVYNIQFYHSSFRSVKIIQKPKDTHYSSIFKYKLFFFFIIY